MVCEPGRPGMEALLKAVYELSLDLFEEMRLRGRRDAAGGEKPRLLDDADPRLRRRWACSGPAPARSSGRSTPTR